MPNPFSFTLRSIQADSARPGAIAAAVGALGLGLWGIWFLAADLTVYAISREARVEVAQSPSPVVAERGGVVVAVHARAGDPVSEGDVLVELKIDADLIDLDGARAGQDALSITLDARKQALAARVAAYESERRTLEAVVSSAESARRSAEVTARQAADGAARAQALYDQAVIGSAERDAAQAAAQVAASGLSASMDALRSARDAMAQRDDEHQAELATLQGEVDSLASQLEVAWAGVSRRELEVERAQIRAPASGVLGSLEALAVGSPVTAGAVIGAVVPEGDLQVVAGFAPSDAIGRIQPGQRARLRLTGFPWTQFGVIEATVRAVASEPRDGLIRVELEPARDPGSALPLQHALPGEVEVAVEQVSPATLALRAAGRMVAAGPAVTP